MYVQAVYIMLILTRDYRDGTLVTQRLHFAQVPHPHRHVLGWYRLVKELETCGVSAICVFDGKERSAAKAQEVRTSITCVSYL